MTMETESQNMDFQALFENLKAASKNGFQCVKSGCKFTEAIVPPLVLPAVPLTPSFPEAEVDFDSIKYLASSLESFGLIPSKTTGDGSCLLPCGFIAFIWESKF